MTTQLTMEREEVAVCTGCRLARSTQPNYYARQHPQCEDCRAQNGEELTKCDVCEESDFTADMYEEYIFMSPFDDEEQATGVAYCRPCVDRGANDPDGEFFTCDGCYRKIASDNGHITHYRILNDYKQICLKCIEDDLKQGGVAALNDDDLLEQVFKGQVFGMFFDVGELAAEGWTADPDYDDVVMDTARAGELGARCRLHHDAGRLFIIEYERLSIVRDEGYITLRTKQEAPY